MSALAAAILSLSVVHVTPTGDLIYARQLRKHPLGAEGYAQHLAHYVEDAAELQGVDPWLLVALWYHESAFDDRAVEPSTGARGIAQLMPTSSYARASSLACELAHRDRVQCLWVDVLYGASAVRDAIDACGDEELGIGFYRAGKCIAGPRVQRVLELRDRLRAEYALGG